MALLVVDDDPIILRLMDGVLSSLGYADVQYAASGEEALQKISRSGDLFSTFLLDIKMPGMDGIELVRHIRANPLHRRTPILMLTSVTEKPFIDAAFATGATDYITKPIEVQELGARLRVAQALYSEQQRASDSVKAAQVLRSEIDSLQQGQAVPFELADPITLYDVPRVINALAMENYLHRLSRLRRFMVAAVGFQIRRVESLYSMSSPAEFRGILTDVAEAVFENLRHLEVMITYYGNGSFVAVLPRVNAIDREDLEVALGMTLAEFGLTIDCGLPMNVSVSVGEQVHTSMFDTSPKDLIAKTIPQAYAQTRTRSGALQQFRGLFN